MVRNYDVIVFRCNDAEKSLYNSDITAIMMKMRMCNMQAYEFYAVPKNGLIPIPEKYRSQITDNVMVIVLEKKPGALGREAANNRKKTDLLSPPSLKTKGWKFSREDANER